MPPESPHWIPTHLVALLLVWSITCLAIVAAFTYSLARLIIKKADVGDLPQILTPAGSHRIRVVRLLPPAPLQLQHRRPPPRLLLGQVPTSRLPRTATSGRSTR
jgi:hypothetical protein